MRVDAHAIEAPLLQHAQQIGLQLRRDVADFVEKKRTAAGHLELALGARAGSREGALFVTEELALEQCFRQRRATEGDERLAGAIPRIVNGARHQFLARSAGAVNQHGAAQAGDLARQRQDVLHAGVLCDDVVELVLLGEFLPQDLVLKLQVLHLDGPLDQQGDLLRIAGFDDVLESALLEGGDRGIHRGVCRDDDEGRFGLQAPDAPHRLDAVHAAGHFQIDEAHGIGVRAGEFQRGSSGAGSVHGVAVFAQPRRDRSTHHGFVIDD